MLSSSCLQQAIEFNIGNIVLRLGQRIAKPPGYFLAHIVLQEHFNAPGSRPVYVQFHHVIPGFREDLPGISQVLVGWADVGDVFIISFDAEVDSIGEEVLEAKDIMLRKLGGIKGTAVVVDVQVVDELRLVVVTPGAAQESIFPESIDATEPGAPQLVVAIGSKIVPEPGSEDEPRQQLKPAGKVSAAQLPGRLDIDIYVIAVSDEAVL